MKLYFERYQWEDITDSVVETQGDFLSLTTNLLIAQEAINVGYTLIYFIQTDPYPFNRQHWRFQT